MIVYAHLISFARSGFS